MSAMELGFFAIPVSNMGTAKTFYGPLMGWEFRDRDPKFAYIFANEKMVGSLELENDNFRSSEHGPLLFFRAETMDKTLARVSANGGRIKERLAIEEGARGYTAKVTDPSGNTIGFWAPES